MWPFRRRVDVVPEQLLHAVKALHKELRALQSEHEALEDAFVQFRARTYGKLTKRPGGRGADLHDASLTKAEVRAQLAEQGQLKPR